jgi:hypothetical protein
MNLFAQTQESWPADGEASLRVDKAKLIRFEPIAKERKKRRRNGNKPWQLNEIKEHERKLPDRRRDKDLSKHNKIKRIKEISNSNLNVKQKSVNDRKSYTNSNFSNSKQKKKKRKELDNNRRKKWIISV